MIVRIARTVRPHGYGNDEINDGKLTALRQLFE
jgi:hypothetical protein